MGPSKQQRELERRQDRRESQDPRAVPVLAFAVSLQSAEQGKNPKWVLTDNLKWTQPFLANGQWPRTTQDAGDQLTDCRKTFVSSTCSSSSERVEAAR